MVAIPLVSAVISVAQTYLTTVVGQRVYGIELRLASVRSQARELLARRGLAGRVRMERTLDAALT